MEVAAFAINHIAFFLCTPTNGGVMSSAGLAKREFNEVPDLSHALSFVKSIAFSVTGFSSPKWV